MRAGTIEALGAHLRRRTPTGEAFQVEADPAKWLLVTLDGPKHEPFLADALEAGYVWDEHMVSVGNKQIRKPKKDGWFEHGMNCLEYLELTFGASTPTAEAKARRRQRQPGPSMPTGPTGYLAS